MGLDSLKERNRGKSFNVISLFNSMRLWLLENLCPELQMDV